MVKVSVILAVYNNKKDIFTAIDSVISQTFEDWELIIIDDCSTDGVFDLLTEFIKDNPVFNITLLRNSKNIGVYSSRNEGLLRAKGEYISIIDSDDNYDETMLEKCIDTLDENKDYVGILSKYSRNGRIYQGDVTLVYRKNIIDKIGYYDSVRFAADTEFVRRIKKVFGNDKIHLINEVLYYAIKRKNSLTTSEITGLRAAKLIRRDYIAKSDEWHNINSDIYMKYPLIERPFEVNSIMLP